MPKTEPKTLEELLGPELYSQVKERLGETEIVVADPDNPQIPKHRLDEVIAERNRYKDLAAEHEKKISDLKAEHERHLNDLKAGLKDNDTFKAQIAELQAKYKEASEEYTRHLRDQQFSFAIERAVAAADARNVRAVIALLDKSKISLDGDNLLGFDAQITALKESDPYLFGVELKGRVPEGTGKPAKEVPNPWKKESFNLTKQGHILKTDPELAVKLRAEAGVK